VGRNHLLLLTHGAEKAECVRAEADHAQQPERHEAQHRGARHRQALARAGRGEYQERQHQPRRDLDADSRRQRDRGGAKAGAGSGAEGQRGGERQKDQRVVVGAADCKLEQHRVQADEGGSKELGVTELAGGPRDQRDRAETRGDRDRLEGPQPPGEPQWRGRIAREREQRAVGGVQERPADEPEHRVGGRFGRHVRVRVQAVEGSQAGEALIPEDVL